MKTVAVIPSQRLWRVTEIMWAICLYSAQNTVNISLILKLLLKISRIHIINIQKAGMNFSYYTERYRENDLFRVTQQVVLEVNTKVSSKKKHVQRWLASVIELSLTQDTASQVKSSVKGWFTTTVVKQRTYLLVLIHALTSNLPKDGIL